MKVYNTLDIPRLQEKGAPHGPTRYVLKETNKSTRPCSNNKSINNIKSSSSGPHSGPDTCPIHQATTYLLPSPLPGVLTYAHINRIDDHCKGGKPHTQPYKQAKG